MTTSPGPVHETAATTDDAALTFRGVDHVSLTVTDLNVSARFYPQVLGFTVVLDFGYGLACIHKTTGFTRSLIRLPRQPPERRQCACRSRRALIT